MLLEINSFSGEATDAAMLQRYPGSTIGANRVYRDIGFQGDAFTARDGACFLFVDTPSLTNQRSIGVISDTLIIGFHLRFQRPKSDVTLLSIRKNGLEQLKVVMARPIPSANTMQLHFVGGGKLLYSSEVYQDLTWTHFELKVEFGTGGFIEWRVDDVAEIRINNLDMTRGANVSGWDSILIGLQAADFNSFVSIDDLVIMDDTFMGAGAAPLDNFIGPHVVDPKHIKSTSAVIAGVQLSPAGTASSVADAIDDSVTGDFNGDTSYATSSGTLFPPYTTDDFQFDDAEYANGDLKAMMMNVDARNEGGTFNILWYVWNFGTGFMHSIGFSLAVDSTSYKRYNGLFLTVGGLQPIDKTLINTVFGDISLLRIAGDSNLRISNVFMEVLTTPIPEVIADTLPSGTIYPAPIARPNWRDGIKITTAWQTSIRRMKFTAAEERRSLSSRPVRTISTTFTGLERDLTENLLQGAALRTIRNSYPQPIWPDEMLVTVATGQVDANGKLEVDVDDTLYRRLARGQRIALAPNIGARERDYDSTTWWILSRWTRTKLFLDADRLPTGQIPGGGYEIRARVYPCMDVELSLASRVSMLTSEIGEHIGASSVEVQGQSTLPPIVTNITSSRIPAANGIPFLELKEDWSGATPVSTGRHGTKVPSGKGSYFDVDGERPVFSFARRFTFLTRAQWWDFLGIFDALRGMGGSLWLASPQEAWEFISITSGTVLKISVPDWFQDSEFTAIYSHIALQTSLTEANKKFTVQKILSLTRVSPTIIEITLDAVTGIRTGDVKRVTPAHLCRFSSDALIEFWESKERVIVTAGFESLEDEEPKSVPNVIANPVDKMEPDTLAELFFMLDANKNSYHQFGLTNTYEQSIGWPHRAYRADVVFDARVNLDKFIADPGFQQGGLPLPHMRGKTLSSAIDTDPHLQTFARPHLRNGKRILLGGDYQFGAHVAGHENSSEVEKVFWDNKDGMTILFCWLDPDDINVIGIGNGGGLPAQLLRVADQAGNLIFEWDAYGRQDPSTGFNEGRIRMYRQPGVTGTALDLYHEPWGKGRGVPVAAFRWDPNSAANTQYFLEGPIPPKTAAVVAPMPIPFGPYSPESQLGFFGRSSLIPVSNRADQALEGFEVSPGVFKTLPGLFGMLIYKRALTNAEINIAANYYRVAYNANWSDI